MTTTVARLRVTPEYAVAALLHDLRKFTAMTPQDAGAVSAWLRGSTAAQAGAIRQQRAADAIRDIEAACDAAGRLAAIRRHDNEIANMGQMVGWRSTAKMVLMGGWYVLSGGVLCETTRDPAGLPAAVWGRD